MAKKILFAGFKGGAGVTTCAVEAGKALAAEGERVLYCDGDCECGVGTDMSGAAGAAFCLAEYAAGGCRARQLIMRHPKIVNFCVLSTLGCADARAAARAVSEVEGLFDYILTDGFSADGCERAVVVTEPYAAALKCADKCLARLKDCGIDDALLAVNKFNGGMVLDGLIMTPEEISNLLHAPLAAVIPEDLSLCWGGMKKQTAEAFLSLAKFLSGKSTKISSSLKPYFGIVGAVRRKLRKII